MSAGIECIGSLHTGCILFASIIILCAVWVLSPKVRAGKSARPDPRRGIPEDVRKDVIELDLKRGCVYCGKTWEKWLTYPTRTNLPSWEHLGKYSYKSPQSWNIMLCCHSCNCSQKPGVEKWIAEGYPRTVECNITLKTVAPAFGLTFASCDGWESVQHENTVYS